MAGPQKTKHKMAHEQRLFWIAILAGLPGAIVSLFILWTGDYTPKVQWTLTVLIAGFWWGAALALRERVVLPLQTMSNLLAALREGDYSIRARATLGEDALNDVMYEANALRDTLREQRLGALEATALLRKVMAEIDVAVYAFDGEQKLRLVNRAGERLLAQPEERLRGRMAQEVGLQEFLEGSPTRTIEAAFPGGSGRWGLRRSTFREGGLPHQLVVVSDLSRALREEERQAWQRLIRVMGHELNNSLAPIKSMSGSLESLVVREPLPSDWREDVRRGLSVIGARAEALNRFMRAYSQLAKLPKPQPVRIDVSNLLTRVAGLETRLRVVVVPGPDLFIEADGDQLEQLMINLLRNAADAALETGGGVRTGWAGNGQAAEVWVEDEGPGISNTTNLFVPFFTTKPGGSGIGLVLCRQIAEAHGGTLMLENRTGAIGCRARLRLPKKALPELAHA
ncbi:MAG: PAS domain-containing sensor histidine kinase [Acidobacteria bacterium]|nr:PAS domain-containing sensor histidine kinase [Acidobacteriota bacterium]